MCEEELVSLKSFYQAFQVECPRRSRNVSGNGEERRKIAALASEYHLEAQDEWGKKMRMLMKEQESRQTRRLRRDDVCPYNFYASTTTIL